MATENVTLVLTPNADAEVRLEVEKVDFSLRAYDGGNKFFSVGKEDDSKSCVLQKGRTYIVHYDNNDRGEGFLVFRIVQIVDVFEQTLYEVDLSSISGSLVLKYKLEIGDWFFRYWPLVAYGIHKYW
ncbi:MAG: hypothetical protein GY847_00500, partial [Proteobacteria bacterium]|nr:hypothetical protein [Pseudomonadota bacterium]